MKNNYSSKINFISKHLFALLVLFFLVIGTKSVSAATRTASVNGNWSSTATWGGAAVPVAGDVVIINNGINVTVNVAAVCNSITINGGNTSSYITISNTYSLTVSGAVTINAGSGSGDNKYIAVGTGTLTCASITIPAAGNANRYSGITLSTGTVNVTGNITFGDINDDFTFTDAGTLNIGGNLGNGGTFTASTGTVNYNGTTQSVGAYTYYNLTISGGGVKTLLGATTVTRTLLLISGNLVTTATNLITITNNTNSGIMGGSSSSYIKGPVQWYIPFSIPSPTTYLFPVGDASYLPLSVNNSAIVGWNQPALQVQAFSLNAGGNKGTLASLSTSEYWSLTQLNATLTASVTLGNALSIYPYNTIAGCATKNGTYSSLGGTASFYEVSNSNTIGSNQFFVLASNGSPKITVAPPLLGGFAYTVNFGPSAEQTFTVNGSSLSTGITINAPTDFEISLTSGTGFQSTITLPAVSGKVASTIIYLRLKAGLAVGSYPSENITLTSTGATTVQITCNGTVFASTPTITTSGGRLCPPNNNQVQLTSSSDNINILYWSGPNNFYAQKDTLINPADATYNGTYTVTGTLPTGANLLINGDFEAGNLGFLSSYSFVNVVADGTNNTAEGIYAVIANPHWLHNNFLNRSSDHTPDPGTLQMVINGATTANVTIWSETVKVVPNSTYQFSYWLQSVTNTNPSVLQLYANNQPVGTPFTATLATDVYRKYYYNWYSGSNTSVTLDLRNQNTIPGGNDFAIDDIDFRTVTYVSSSLNVSASTAAAVSISTPTTSVATGTSVIFTATPTNGGSAPLYQWLVNGANVGTNSSSSTFNYVPSNGDIITCTMTSNNSCTSPITATSNTITMTVTGVKNYWLGALGAGGTVWSDKTNWTTNTVPASGDNVEFATTGNNSGVAAKNDLYLDFNRIAGNLINNASGKNLVIPANKELVVNNNITLTPVDANSTYDQIQIKCDPNPVPASRLPNGSLIFPNATNVNATVEMYSGAYINAAGGNNDSFFWQYFGIPIATIKADPMMSGAYVRRSNEAGTIAGDDYWIQLSNTDDLDPFIGYELCQPLATTYVFKGKLINADYTSTQLPYSSGASYPGEHLFANPYTAAIDVNKMIFGTDLEASVYLYNTGSYGNWVTNNGGTSNGNSPGQYTSIPKLPAGNNGLPQEVPSMSSMLIKTGTTPTGNSAFSVSYKDVIIKNSTIQRVKKASEVATTDLVSTRIDLTGEHYSDRMWIFTEPSCTPNFDNGWDGRKFLGSSLAPQIYAVEPDGNYQVNSVSDMQNTDIAFQPGDEVEYTLKFTHDNIQRYYAGVYLVDLLENKTIDITQSGTTYKFATAPATTPTNRFKIITRHYEKSASDTDSQIKIFSARGSVFVHNLSTSNGECTLYDIVGHAIMKKNYGPNTATEVATGLVSGAYVISASTNGEKVSKRVIVQ